MVHDFAPNTEIGILLSLHDSCWQLLFPVLKKLPPLVHIKTTVSAVLSLSLMAELQPTNLEDFCKLYNCSFFSLKFPCVFCKHLVDYLGLAEFHHKSLSLIYKNNQCFACCSPCLKVTAKYEIEQFYRCSVDASCIEYVCKKPLADIIVRCILCYRLLDFVEKYDCVVAELPFILVRHHWRNYCRHCVKQI